MGAPNYLSWIIFARQLNNNNKHPRVLTYINIRLIQLYFSLRKNLFNHKNINLILFFNCGIICFIINIYSDEWQSTLKYLKDTEVNLNNILIVTENFNISNNDWDPSYLHHSIHVFTLREIADSFNLELSMHIIQVSI